MDLKQIRYFLSVAETLNFTEAAEHNSISQPALTKAVQKLEGEVGGALIFRDGKHSRLTELGRKLRNEFATIVEGEERARQIAATHVDGGQVTLNIGISNSLGPIPFVDLLADVATNNPATRMILHQVSPDIAQQEVLSGMLDVCFCSSAERPNPKIREIPLFKERLMVAMAPGHPLSEKSQIELSDFGEHQYLDRLNCEFRPGIIKTMTKEGLPIRSSIQSEREDWIQQLIANGHGVTVLGEFARVVAGIELRPFAKMEIFREVAMISMFGTSASSAISLLERAAKQHDWPKT